MNLIDRLKFIGNSVCKNDTSSYFLAFFHSFFPIVIPSIYTDKIFFSVCTEGYYKDIFSWKNSPQSTDKNIMSVYPFVFVNFLVVDLL